MTTNKPKGKKTVTVKAWAVLGEDGKLAVGDLERHSGACKCYDLCMDAFAISPSAPETEGAPVVRCTITYEV